MNTSPTRPYAVVTGASSGIGLELAKQLAEHGFDLLLCAEDSGLHTAAATVEADGALVQTIQVDLATYDGVERLHAAITASGRPVDVIALNAGFGVGGGDFTHDTGLEAHLSLVALNVTSTVHLAKLVLPAMVERGAGRMLFTSSIAATMPGPYYSTYAASKSFVQSFAEALRHEVKDTGVTVTSLMPGPTDTDFFDRGGMQDTKVDQGSKDDAATVARQGYEAMMAGKDHVVAGSLMNKAQAVVAGVLPDTVKAAMHARLTKPQ